VSFTFLERYELKYWVPPRLLSDVRAFVEMFLEPEHRGQRQTNVSLYLDSLDHTLYRAHVGGSADRFKLRVRRYGSGSSETVFAEVKRKVKDVVVKTRAVIPASAWSAVIEPVTGPTGRVDSFGAVADPLLQDFAYRVAVTRAVPQLIVACTRSAWVPAISLDTTRVTLDEEITALPYRGAFFDLDPRHAVAIDGEDAHLGFRGRLAMLELKFTGAAPGWMSDLTRRFGLQRTNYSKFVAATRILDERALLTLLGRVPLLPDERRVGPDELLL
jgi:hypothetical protein